MGRKEEYMKENKLLNNGARRLSNLINKSDIFIELISIELIQNFCELIFKDGYHIGGVDAREPLKTVESKHYIKIGFLMIRIL